jgi:hypothetical protein
VRTVIVLSRIALQFSGDENVRPAAMFLVAVIQLVARSIQFALVGRSGKRFGVAMYCQRFKDGNRIFQQILETS